MDLFKMELRNIFGVLAPGALLLLVILYVVTMFPVDLECWLIRDLWSGKHEVLNITLMFLLSYLLGSLLRLNSAGRLDIMSGEEWQKAIENDLRNEGKEVSKFVGVLEQFDEEIPRFREDEIKMLGEYDSFPYPILQLNRVSRNCPNGYLETLRPLLKRMSPKGDFPFKHNKKKSKLVRLKEIVFSGGKVPNRSLYIPFNYCKSMVFSAADMLGTEIIHEIRSVETEVRYFSGTYFALSFGALFLLILAVSQTLCIAMQSESLFLSYIARGMSELRKGAVVSFMLSVIFWRVSRAILIRFRTLRIKEVDMVLDIYAFGVMKGCITYPVWPPIPAMDKTPDPAETAIKDADDTVDKKVSPMKQKSRQATRST